MSRADDAAVSEPTACPFCRSDAVTATDRKRSLSTYWRCEGCGQVWHPERLRATAPAVGYRRW
jgi:hypothetical protein